MLLLKSYSAAVMIIVTLNRDEQYAPIATGDLYHRSSADFEALPFSLATFCLDRAHASNAESNVVWCRIFAFYSFPMNKNQYRCLVTLAIAMVAAEFLFRVITFVGPRLSAATTRR